jgi:hypothetical protein
MSEEKPQPANDQEETRTEKSPVKPLTITEKSLLVGVPAVLLVVMVVLALRKPEPPRFESAPLPQGLNIIGVSIEPGPAPNMPKGAVLTFDQPIDANTVNVSTVRVVKAGKENSGDFLSPKSVILLNITQARIEFPKVKWPEAAFRFILVNPAAAPGHPATDQPKP